MAPLGSRIDAARSAARGRHRRRRIQVLLNPAHLLVLLALLNPDLAQAQVTDLTVVESGDDAVLTWSTGTAPYRVLRSTSPDFYFGNRTVADDLSASSIDDSGALRRGNHSYFYDVLVAGQSGPLGFALNPPSASPPSITDISPGSGEPGDLVTITGNGFVADGSRMIVTFHHAIAELVSASETSLQVVVPTGAYTGNVLVCIASDICSNPYPFAITYGPAFQDISSIAYESGTGSLWVADRGSADTVYEIDATGTIAPRGTLAQPLLGSSISRRRKRSRLLWQQRRQRLQLRLHRVHRFAYQRGDLLRPGGRLGRNQHGGAL